VPTWDIRFACTLEDDKREIVALLARIDALSAVIHGIPLPPAVQRHIDSLNILRAVRGTTGIEGTEVSEVEVERILASPPETPVLPQARRRAELEVRNAERVMRFVAAAVRQEPGLPVTEQLVCQIHRLTTENIDYPHNMPGVYRSHPVSAGTYVPPRTLTQIRRLMQEFVRWLNAGPPRGWHAAVRAVAAHFYLISIHPFGDGNGRTARGLESFLLYQGGLNARGFYSLSNYYYQHRPEYVAMLDHVRFATHRDITPFIEFALQGLVEEQETIHREILDEVTVIAFRDFARDQLTHDRKLGTKSGERMFHLLLGLPRESLSVRDLSSGGHPLSRLYHGVTAKTLSRDLNYLRGRGLIIVEHGQIRANLDVMKEFM